MTDLISKKGVKNMASFKIVALASCEICGSEVTEIDGNGHCQWCAWEVQAKDELRDMGHEAEIENCEICENGQVHFHRDFFDITGPDYVIRFSKFMEG